MDEKSIYAKIGEFKVIPIVAIDSVESALPLADALIAGGLPVAEITFRTAAAADVITLLKRERPELLLGAGTLLSADNVRRAKDCGAEFGVAPGLNPKVVREAVKIGLPFAPGIMTPSDVEAALDFGIKALKFFPAGAAGGLEMLRSLSAPYAHLGVKYIPTGGVNLENAAEYLGEKIVLAVGGTWLAKKDDIASGNWSKITDNCRRVTELVAGMKK